LADTVPVAPAALPTSSAEATNAMIHYYRAEMGRMNAWRSRLDLTSNWAITVVAALLSVSLSTPAAHHGLFLFAMLLVSLLLGVEARRYRFYDVYRMRVRQFERHYFGQLFGPDAEGGPEPWLMMLAQDLRHPKFRISFRRAVGRRLRRNYIWMFLILILAWMLKIASPDLQSGVHLDPQRPIGVLVEQAATGPAPGWLVVGMVTIFYLGILYLTLTTKERGGDEVHV
jgi:Predicted integral membrane protein